MEEFKISANDPYDLDCSLRGFNLQMTFMQSNIYEFQFWMAFKKTYKPYADAFEMQFLELSFDNDFYLRTEDPWVIHCVKTRDIMLNFQAALNLRFGLDVVEHLHSKRIVAESDRMKPFNLAYVYSKSYRRLKMYYQRTLTSHIYYLYYFACIFMSSKYRIPRVLKQKFNIEDSSSLYLLDQDNNLVSEIRDMIIQLMSLLDELKKLNTAKPSRATKKRVTTAFI